MRALEVNGFWRDADWLLCRDGKWRPVEPGTFPLVDGAAARLGRVEPGVARVASSNRVGRLKGYGNAINAQAAASFALIWGCRMASSWIKVEVITPDKPEIFQIAEILNIDPDAVLGKLVRIWAWADQQTVDGNAGSVTKGVLDRIAFITGFADALIAVGWLAYDGNKLILPNFERHNGESSKKRALTNRRVAAHRKNETQKVTLAALQKALPEEEEEEEEEVKIRSP
jgi:hypothetical protein